MTHPSLPNGFSRDFSEAHGEEIIVYVKLGISPAMPNVGVYSGGEFQTLDGFTYDRSELLCWCPIPTPGDAVLKELAEEGK